MNPAAKHVRHLSRKECPDGSVLAIFNDVHLGIEDTPALKVAAGVAEGAGATHFIVNGDGADCGCISPHHGKKKRSQYEHGTLEEEIAPGRWFLDWIAGSGRKSILGTGNHEDWINDLALETGMVGTTTVRSALNIDPRTEVLEHGYQIRLGSLVIEHGDLLLGRSSGGPTTASRILAKYPDQSTICGHFHIESSSFRTSFDAGGILRTRGAYTLGHLSDPAKHWEYASRAPNWQQGLGIVEVFYIDGKPRYDVTQVGIHRDRYNRPYATYRGKVYR
jgi:hypothetical protein